MATDYLNQPIVATALIEPKNNDSFYNPVLQGHSGFAFDGQFYDAGVLQIGHPAASWYSEGSGSYRGLLQQFPSAGLILLSRAALTILDETTSALNLWIQFIMRDGFALTDNFNSTLQGFIPHGLSYADGIISVIYAADPGSIAITSNMIVSVDFSQDSVYLDVAT